MMMASCEQKIMKTESQQWVPLIPKSSEISVLIYSLEAVTRIGKNFPIIFLTLASLNVFLAANDFLSNRIEFGIMNSLFAINGFVALAQMYYNKLHPIPLADPKSGSKIMEIRE